MSKKKLISDITAMSPGKPPQTAPIDNQMPPSAPQNIDASPIPKTPADAYPDSNKQKEKQKPKKPHKKIFGGINHETSEYVIESLSMLLLAGVSVGEALESIAGEITKKPIKKIVLNMRTSIDDGTSFSSAIAQTGLFNESVVTLIEVGEATGRLPQNLRVVADQMHKNNVMNAKIKSAMLYPAFLVTLLFIVGTGIGVFLLPKLLSIITSLQVKVGPITKALIFIGTYFGKYGIVFSGGVVILGAFLGIAIKLNRTVRAMAEWILYHLPGIKKLLFEVEVARFGFILGSLLDAGLPVVAALQSLTGSMSTRRYQRFAASLCAQIDEGNPFSKILAEPKNRKLLSGTICQIIISAEKSGNLANSLLKIGRNYEDKADITAHNLETLLEPIVLVLIAVGVLFVALAVFLPIYSLIGNFNGGK